MAATQKRLVHKQFNSPINLYSQKNIQETLDRELKLLSNGAVGIDFDDPSTTKPPSLAKSAVLAALEEEEREKSRGTAAFGRQSRSRQPTRPTDPRTVSPCIDRETVLKINRRPLQRRHRSCDNFWPPRSPATGEAHGRHRSPARDEGLKRVAWPPPTEGPEYEVHPSQQKQHAVGQQIPPQQQQQQFQPQQFYQQTNPQQQQQQYQPAYQQTSFPPQQQQQHPHQPVERIVPIQRATSIQSPLGTPTKSPVNQLKYPSYPPASPQSPVHYPAAGPPASARGPPSSTVAFSGGRAVLPNKPQQYAYQQQRGGYGNQAAPRSPVVPAASPRSPGLSTLGGSGSPRGWAHVASPQQQQQQQQYHQGYGPAGNTGSAPQAAWYGARKPEAQQQQPLAPQYQNPLEQQPYQPQPTEAFQPLTAQQQQPLYQPAQPQQHQQLPPTLITTLRKEPPMSQEPAPVYQTQPVAAIYQGGSNMRGDQKWPPEEYKRQSEVDNEERRKLAQQPAFRPRRQQKDYADFFAKNALNNTYPGYRAPPGTQHHA
ncbi:basic-leucine zipper transcription factor A isoform X5 [Anopheles stephensi]|uniref:basic-leucine zipper transcription factor A isoform X5 n=1 Tax=Anopheles stephensi TaxID=30069 RepID=UPI0016588286|nr:basic-leucine zipper transcription factor A isoform X5 [Anopheles stephensi]